MNYFLDDDITVYIELDQVALEDMYVNYSVRIYNYNAWKEVFAGKYFLREGEDRITIDITDIVRNYRYIYDFKNANNIGGKLLITSWNVVLTSSEWIDFEAEEWPFVWHSYKYPHADYENLFDGLEQDVSKCHIIPALQSTKLWKNVTTRDASTEYTHYLYKTDVVPHYPCISTDYYYFRQVLFCSSSSESPVHYILDDETDVNFEFTPVKNGSSDFRRSLDDILDGNLFYKELKMCHSAIDYQGHPNAVTVAKFDECPAHFYLQWQDRFGSIQSQGFDAKDIYTEDFSYTKMENYKGHQRNLNVEVTPKWELTTKWLSDKEMPIYESLFVSPYVLLYDTELDKSYKVIVSDNKYTEKTHRNQRNLYKLTINVSLDKNQNVLA